jgi:competence protein ComEC
VERKIWKRRDLIVLCCLGFLIGVALLSRWVADNMFFYLALLVLGLVVWRLWKSGVLREWSDWKSLVLMFLLALLAGLLRMGIDLAVTGNLSDFNDLGRKVSLQTEVAAAPVVVENDQQLLLKASQLKDQRNRFSVDGLIKLKVPRFPSYELGDWLEVDGLLETPQNFDEGFNYVDFLAKDKIHSVIKKAYVRKIPVGEDWFYWPLKVINYWNRQIVGKLQEIFPEPAAGIIAGVQVGARSSIPADVLKNFQTVGLTHILAISGFNITLIINVVAVLLAGFSRRKRFWLNLGLIVLFVFLTGCSASVVRAAVMGMMILLIKTLGRKSEVLTVIMLSAVLMVLVSPRILNFDISFQLSLMATLSLVLYSEKLEQWAVNWPEQIKEGVLVTLSAQVLTLPISFYNFGNISLIAPISNLLVLPLVPVLMATSFASLILSVFNLGLAKWTGGVSWLIVELMIKTVEILSKIPLAAVAVGKGLIWLVLVYYLLVFRFFHKPEPGKYSLPYCALPDGSVSS